MGKIAQNAGTMKKLTRILERGQGDEINLSADSSNLGCVIICQRDLINGKDFHLIYLNEKDARALRDYLNEVLSE